MSVLIKYKGIMERKFWFFNIKMFSTFVPNYRKKELINL